MAKTQEPASPGIPMQIKWAEYQNLGRYTTWGEAQTVRALPRIFRYAGGDLLPYGPGEEPDPLDLWVLHTAPTFFQPEDAAVLVPQFHAALTQDWLDGKILCPDPPATTTTPAASGG